MARSREKQAASRSKSKEPPGPAESGCRYRSQVSCRVEASQGEIHNLVTLDPSVIDGLEPLEVDDEDGRKSPDLELLDGQLVRLAAGAVILLVLTQFFLL